MHPSITTTSAITALFGMEHHAQHRLQHRLQRRLSHRPLQPLQLDSQHFDMVLGLARRVCNRQRFRSPLNNFENAFWSGPVARGHIFIRG